MRPSSVVCRAAPRLALAAAVAGWLGACRYATTTPSPSTAASSGSTTSGSTSLTYTTDVAPILNADCVRCHGLANHQAGVDLSTYQNVMRLVVAGNVNSILVLVTQPSGLMYSQFSGNRTTKATTIRDWIVSSNAAQ